MKNNNLNFFEVVIFCAIMAVVVGGRCFPMDGTLIDTQLML